MKLKTILKTAGIFIILINMCGCNLFQSADKPTDSEDAKYKSEEALKEADKTKDYDSAIVTIEDSMTSVSKDSSDYKDLQQIQAEAYMGKAGVNAFDVASILSTNDSSIINTLDGINVPAIKKASSIYADIIPITSSAKSSKRAVITSSGVDISNFPDDYASICQSAAFAKGILAAHYLAVVYYQIDENEKIFVDIAAKEVTNASGAALVPRKVSDMKAKWKLLNKDGYIINLIIEAITYFKASSLNTDTKLTKALAIIKKELLVFNVDNLPDDFDKQLYDAFKIYTE